jgi:hypothetical protein
MTHGALCEHADNLESFAWLALPANSAGEHSGNRRPLAAARALIYGHRGNRHPSVECLKAMTRGSFIAAQPRNCAVVAPANAAACAESTMSARTACSSTRCAMSASQNFSTPSLGACSHSRSAWDSVCRECFRVVFRVRR